MIYGFVSWAVTSWVMFEAVPAANQTFREIVYGVITQRVETEIKPRVFFEDFPNRVLYVGDTTAGGAWRDVFLADTSHPEEPTVFTASAGRLVIDREKRRVDLVLLEGARHTANLKDPTKYEIARFAELILGLDPDSVFRITEILKGDNEMTIPELRARAAELKKQGLSPHGPLMALHRKFSLPVACLVFALIGLALGLQQARGGKLAAFVPGIAVIFAYYILEYQGRQMAKGQLVPPWLAVWGPDLDPGRRRRRAAPVARALRRQATAAVHSRAVAVLEIARARRPRDRRRRGVQRPRPHRPRGGRDSHAASQSAVVPPARRLRVARWR